MRWLADPPVPSQDPDEVRRLARDILGGDEFAEPDRSFLLRALDWIARQLDRIFGRDGGEVGFDVGRGGSGGSVWLTVLVAVAAVVAVVLVVRATRGRWTRRRRPPEPLAVDVEAHRSPDDWDDLARRLEAEGRWHEGMRARFGSLVGRLSEAGLVPDAPGRTSGEYRADVHEAVPDAAAAFADAAELFERAWYGALPTGPGEAGRFAADAERVLVAAGVSR